MAGEDSFNMNVSTEVYTSMETYIHSLNTDLRLGSPNISEVSLLNRALLAERDADAAKQLVVSFL